MRIAILGATGHVAQCALWAFSQRKDAEFFLFSRSKERLEALRMSFPGKNISCFSGYSSFDKNDYDIVFNGIGVWDTPNADAREIFRVTEFYDNMIMDYQKAHPACVSIHVSSGAVYGGEYLSPVTDETVSQIPINSVRTGDYYTAAKLNSEIKHRAYSDLSIVDIRLFGFFSRYMSLKYRYLMSGIINSIKEGRPFGAIGPEFYRDFIHLDDFSALLNAIAGAGINTSIDVRSKKPVSKSELLDYFVKNFGLKVYQNEDPSMVSKTGVKPYYYSLRESALYTPRFTSIETVENEIHYFLHGGEQ